MTRSRQGFTTNRRSLLKGAAITAGLVVHRSSSSRAQAPETLRSVASSRGVNVGALYNVDLMRSQSELMTHFNMALNAGYLNWYEQSAPRFSLRASESQFNFGNADKAARFAQENDMKHEAHHLVWGWPSKIPGWLVEGGYSPEDLMTIVHDHVATVVGEFKGCAHAYSVVNEPFDNAGNYLESDFWVANSPRSNGMDPDYIAIALRAAHEADPASQLFINDYANEFFTNYFGEPNYRAEAMYYLVARLQDQQVPIDGVGMQMHLDAMMMPDEGTAAWRAEELLLNMARFKANLGVDVFITEFDIKMHNFASQVNPDVGVQQEVQARAYRYLVRAALASGACRNLGFFGVADASHPDNWVEESWSGGEVSDPVLLDDKYQPKAAYQAVMEEIAALPLQENEG